MADEEINNASGGPGAIHDVTTFGPVVVCGLITTAITLAGVWIIEQRYHESPLSFYWFHFVPVGAFLVGMCAGCGYLIAAKVLGQRFGQTKMTIVFVLQVLAYFAAQYIEFKAKHLIYSATRQPVGFWTWFDLIAQSYVINGPGHEPIRLGPAGYVLRILEIVLFSVGAVAWTGALKHQPYCKACGRYRKDKMLATIYASHFATIEEDDTPQQSEQRVVEGAKAAADALFTIADLGSADALVEQLEEHPPVRPRKNLPSRLNIEIVYCPTCMENTLNARLVVRRVVTVSSVLVDKRSVPPEIARQLLNA